MSFRVSQMIRENSVVEVTALLNLQSIRSWGMSLSNVFMFEVASTT